MKGAAKDKIRIYWYKTLKITSNTRGNKEEKLIVHHAHILSIYKDKTNNLFDIVTLRHCRNMVIIYVPQCSAKSLLCHCRVCKHGALIDWCGRTESRLAFISWRDIRHRLFDLMWSRLTQQIIWKDILRFNSTKYYVIFAVRNAWWCFVIDMLLSTTYRILSSTIWKHFTHQERAIKEIVHSFRGK